MNFLKLFSFCLFSYVKHLKHSFAYLAGFWCNCGSKQTQTHKHCGKVLICKIFCASGVRQPNLKCEKYFLLLNPTKIYLMKDACPGKYCLSVGRRCMPSAYFIMKKRCKMQRVKDTSSISRSYIYTSFHSKDIEIMKLPWSRVPRRDRHAVAFNFVE